jgi:hypothetical protein
VKATLNVPAAPAIRKIPLLVAPALRRATKPAQLISSATRAPACLNRVSVPISHMVSPAIIVTKSATAMLVPASKQKTVRIAPKTAIALLTTFAPTLCACWLPDKNAGASLELTVNRIAIVYAHFSVVKRSLAMQDTAPSMVA